MLVDRRPTAEALTKQVLYAAIGALLVAHRRLQRPGLALHARDVATGSRDAWGTSPTACSACTWSCCTSSMWVTPYDDVRGTNGPQVLGLTLLITLPLAELLYRFVELPAMRLRHVGSATARTSASRGPPRSRAEAGAGTCPAVRPTADQRRRTTRRPRRPQEQLTARRRADGRRAAPPPTPRSRHERQRRPSSRRCTTEHATPPTTSPRRARRVPREPGRAPGGRRASRTARAAAGDKGDRRRASSPSR